MFFFSSKFVGFLLKAKFGKTAEILGLVKHVISKVVERKFHTCLIAGKRTNPRLEKLWKSDYPDQDQLNFQ